MYIYENHMGGLFTSNRELSYEECYCETCGDSDWLIGEADTREEVIELLRDYEKRREAERKYQCECCVQKTLKED